MDELPPLPTLPPMPSQLMAYVDYFDGAEYGLVMIAIQRYAAAAVAKERELCAKVCESYGRNVTTVTCAAAIRSGARSLGTVQPPEPPASGLAP